MTEPEATVAFQRRLESLEVALLASEVPERASQPALRFGRKSANELDDLPREDDPHSSASSADSGRNCVRPARWSAMAFCAAGFARISIVSTIASRYSRDRRYATVSSRRAMPTTAPRSASRRSCGSWLCACVTEYVDRAMALCSYESAGGVSTHGATARTPGVESRGGRAPPRARWRCSSGRAGAAGHSARPPHVDGSPRGGHD